MITAAQYYLKYSNNCCWSNRFICGYGVSWSCSLVFGKVRLDFKSTYVKKNRYRVAQSVTCLATDACLTADPGVASSIPVRSHTFVEIDHEMISTVILLPRVFVSYKRKYVHELLVNRLFKPAQEKVWLGELTVPQWP